MHVNNIQSSFIDIIIPQIYLPQHSFIDIIISQLSTTTETNIQSNDFLCFDHSVKHGCIEPSVERKRHEFFMRDIHHRLYSINKLRRFTVDMITSQGAKPNVETDNPNTC